MSWKRRGRALAALAIAGALQTTSCGGTHTTGPDAVPITQSRTTVSGFVFFDENANGTLDAAEHVRLPNVPVAVGGSSAQTTAGGLFTIEGVPTGTQSVTVRPSGLPAYFAPGRTLIVTVPQPDGLLAVPAIQALGPDARPNLYSAFGDSITCGDGSSDGGYRDSLAADLRAFWGAADIGNDCQWGSKSNVGESRIARMLRSRHPSYVLILYGTNDYNDAECKNDPPCYTVEALRSMIVQTREAGAFPVLGTIPPVNPAYIDKGAEDRNYWVTTMNTFVRAMAAQERVALAEVHGDMLKQPSLSALFADDKHPNDAGYAVMEKSFFNAITRPLGTTGASRASEPAKE